MEERRVKVNEGGVGVWRWRRGGVKGHEGEG